MFRHQPEPMFPEYADVYNRLRSFAGHFLPAGQTAEDMAAAGFFYIGKYVHYAHERLATLSASCVQSFRPIHVCCMCEAKLPV